MDTDVESFSRLENLFKWITSTGGNLKTEKSFVMLSTFLHLAHRQPHFSMFSGSMKFCKHSVKSRELKLKLRFGSESERSIKLSKVKLWQPHFLQVIAEQSWPSKMSVIMLLSLARKQRAQISDYLAIGSLSQSIVSYFGLRTTRFSSLCMPSSKNLSNSQASCCPYPLNYLATLEMALFRSLGVITLLDLCSKA